jgi:hypothetical protein
VFAAGAKRSGRFANICDLDGAVDGVCTFYSNSQILKCLLDHDEGCHDIFGDESPPAPCSFEDSPVAVALGPHQRSKTIVRRRLHERISFRCLAAQSAATTTTTTVPGVLNVAGDWGFITRSVTSDCAFEVPPYVGTRFLIQQDGTSLHGCRLGYFAFGGTASASGFTFGPTSSPDDRFVTTITGTSAGGDINVSEVWSGPTQYSNCRITWNGIMAPRRGAGCSVHSDCIAVDGPCSRCFDGQCRIPAPFCRPPTWTDPRVPQARDRWEPFERRVAAGRR